MPAPELSAVPAFYHNYIRQIHTDNVQEAVDGHLSLLISLLKDVPEEGWNYAYAPGKWTLKELVQHLIDAERIFSHRALCIARRDTTPLPGFDEDRYAATSAANARSGTSILEELMAVGTSTACLFRSFGEAQLSATGMANGALISVHAIGYILAGHALHHKHIVEERYLNKG